MRPNRHRIEPAGRARQRGLSLFGLLFFGVIALGLVVLVMRVMPSALEYLAAKRALDKISAIEDIASITGKDLKIVKSGNSVTISFAYEKKVPLVANASLLLEYEANATTK